MDVLLVEPRYKNKYPPLGLMKISAYHKDKGDNVIFVKGLKKRFKDQRWDRIYITTLFTFHWNTTINTIAYYINSVAERRNLYVGGILSTLLYDEIMAIENIRGFTILKGLLDKPGILGNDDVVIDLITPDYEIVDKKYNKYLDFEYKIRNSYIMSTTKGCIRKCRFCAVKTLEPDYLDYIDIKSQITEINNRYGPKRDLMLMDNNILASKSLEKIIEDLIDLGFGRNNKSYLGASRRYLTRHIDFNQGTDARLIDEYTISLLSKLEIKPLRIAFDHADEMNVKIYMKAQRLAAHYGFKNLSNYVLFNYEDTPYELYYRLKVNIDLNEEFLNEGLKTKIWSFPMKYVPLNGEFCKNRKFVGENWNEKLLRGIQCILNATHGVVGTQRKYFEHAFGCNYEEFILILYLPEKYIIKRNEFISNGEYSTFKKVYLSLNDYEYRDFINLVGNNEYNLNTFKEIGNKKLQFLYEKYLR